MVYQNQIENALYKIEGRYLPRPHENAECEAAFDRAKKELIATLEAELQVVASITWKKFNQRKPNLRSNINPSVSVEPVGYPEYVPCNPTNASLPFCCPVCSGKVEIIKQGPANETVTIHPVTGEEVEVDEFSFDDVISRKWACRSSKCTWSAPAQEKA